jgi:Flp pilus assembly protein TadG
VARIGPATRRPGSATSPSRPAAARARRRGRGDDGIATLEFVLVTPALIFLIFVVIQFALWYVARHVVLAAAQEGGRASRDAGQTTAQAEANGQRAALSYVRQIGPGALQGSPGAAVTIAGDVATVTVTGTAASVIPGLTLTIRETSTGAIEKFRGP